MGGPRTLTTRSSPALVAAIVALCAATSLIGADRARAGIDCQLPANPAQQPYDCGGIGAGAFNEPIPPNPTIDPNSVAVTDGVNGGEGMVTFLANFAATLDDSEGTPAIWTVNEADPSSYTTYTVTVSDTSGPNALNGTSFRFPIPNGAEPGQPLTSCETGGSTEPCDDAMDIYDPGSLAHTSNVSFAANPPAGVTALTPSDVPSVTAELRLYQPQMNTAAHTITVAGVGIFSYGAASDGRPTAGTGTGSGLPWVGLIRPTEVQAGVITHALRFVVPVVSDIQRLPATTSDGPVPTNGGADPIPLQEGMRFQLDPSVSCESRTVPWDRTGTDATDPDVKLLHEICVALQTYGAIVVDQSGDTNYGFEMEQGSEVTGVSPTTVNSLPSGPADWATWSTQACAPPAPFLLCPTPGSDASDEYWGRILRDIPDEDGVMYPNEPTSNSWSDGQTRIDSDGIPWDRMKVLATSYFPAISSVAPTTGTTSGDTSVAITGSGFTGATAVDFGSTSVAVKPTSDTSITVKAPAAVAGPVQVRVIGPGATSAIAPANAGQFDYVASASVAVTTSSTATATTTSAASTANLTAAVSSALSSVASAVGDVASAYRQVVTAAAPVLTAARLRTLALGARMPTIAQLRKHSSASFAVAALGIGGRLLVHWYAPPATHRTGVLIAQGTIVTSSANTSTLKLDLTAAGRKLLAHARHVSVTAIASFKSTGIAALAATRTFSLS